MIHTEENNNNGFDEKENEDSNNSGRGGMIYSRPRSQLQRESRKQSMIEEDKNEDFESPQRKDKGYEYWLEAQCLLMGHGIEQNKGYALTWFERSAELSEPLAFYSLGCMYEEGQGVRIDRKKAVEYFKEGAALGDP